jgi:hypothetical protein
VRCTCILGRCGTCWIESCSTGGIYFVRLFLEEAVVWLFQEQRGMGSGTAMIPHEAGSQT